MNSHKSDLIDDLFAQALQPLTTASAPRDAAKKLMRRFHGFSPRVRRLMAWMHSFSAQHFLLSQQPYFTGPYGQYRPSPFLSVTVSHLSGLRLSS